MLLRQRLYFARRKSKHSTSRHRPISMTAPLSKWTNAVIMWLRTMLLGVPWQGEPTMGESISFSLGLGAFMELPPQSVVFPNNTNPFIQARATATNSGVPGAIFRFASQSPGGPQSIFDLPNGLADITRTVYVCPYSPICSSIQHFEGLPLLISADSTSLDHG